MVYFYADAWRGRNVIAEQPARLRAVVAAMHERGLRGQKRESLRYLEEARGAGMDLKDLLKDKDFAALHGDPEFESLLKPVRDEAAKKP